MDFVGVVISDKVYGAQENPKWLRELIIRYSGKPLGGPSAQSQTQYRKRKQTLEQGIRNQFEGKFGQGKKGYSLNKVRARTSKNIGKLDSCCINCDEADKVRQRIFVFFFKRSVLIIISVPDIFIRHQN
jgi:hypothetical protein